MTMLGTFIDRLTGRESARLRGVAQRAVRNRQSALHALGTIQAAAKGGAGPGWSGIQSNGDEDAANKQYLQALGDVLQRSQDLDVNNPDLRGFHRTRTAQIVGPHVKFKASPRSEELDVDQAKLMKICRQIDRLRTLHSDAGGFDSTGNNRSEGAQQERAWLTALVHGCCLIHRVWCVENAILPLSLELIPGVRISTPINRQGDPKISYGIEYSDPNRTRVVAFHVRRVSKTMGDSFIPDFVWDRLPIEDCSLLALTEPAGMDRSMPLSIANVRMLRNRGEFIESSVASARGQSKTQAAIECAPGQNPFDTAADDTDQTVANTNPMGFMTMGDTEVIYLPNGQKINWNAAKLPGPDFDKFMGETDKRLARGMTASLSRFTRQVNSSWAGGRLEDQQDDPIVDQYRRTFVSAWQRVNNWFLEAVWLSDEVEMPGYSARTAVYWSQFRAEFPGKLHINPSDTMAAREKGYMLRTTTPQQATEEDGNDLWENLDQWAQALKMVEEAEKRHGLKPGSITFLVSGKTISTSAGDDIGAPAPAAEPQPGEAPKPQPNLKIAGT